MLALFTPEAFVSASLVLSALLVYHIHTALSRGFFQGFLNRSLCLRLVECNFFIISPWLSFVKPFLEIFFRLARSPLFFGSLALALIYFITFFCLCQGDEGVFFNFCYIICNFVESPSFIMLFYTL